MPLFDFVVSHPTEWPTEIKDLACLLNSPIPSQLVNDPCPVVSSRASPLLETLRNSLTESPEQFTHSDSELLDMLDLVLSTVGTLRALSDASDNDAGHSTIPFWSLLIRSLAFVCYDKSYATQEAAFVRPRLSYVRSFMEDGHASLLISHVVENIRRPRSAVNDANSGHLSMMTAERSKRELRKESDSETSDESSSETSYEHTDPSTDPTSAQSFYVPLDAHILASWRHPNSVVLPFLCVTDEEDIFSLMGGVLYQRSTWGISESVIGIILSNTGFVGRVVLGWLDKECPDPEVLPAIRFAYGDETRTDASLGVYDLTDPVSAVKFSQFILGLRAHVEGIVAQCRNTLTFKRLSWRSDSIDDDNPGTEEQWRQGIVNWLNAVAKCRAPSDSSSSHSCSFPMADSGKRVMRPHSKPRPARRSMSADSKREPLPEPAAEFVSDIDLVHNPEPSLGVAHSKNPPEGASIQSVERGRQEARSDGSKTGKTGKRAKSADALSCSALGAKSLAGISPSAKLSFSSYAHDRKIISLSNIPLQPDAPQNKRVPPEEINEMLQFYEDTTRYMKPPIKKNELPVVDNGVEEVRDHFLMQIDEFPGGENTPELPQRLWEVILGRLSSLLWASVGGYSKLLAGKAPNEAEARHEWDVLLNFGFMAAQELASDRVVLERAVLLSRNIAADVMKDSPASRGAEFRASASQMYKIAALHADPGDTLNAEQDNDSDSPATPDLVLQAIEFSHFAYRNSRASIDLFSNSAKARKAILKRSGDEPELGIVDAILTVPLEGMQLIQEPLIRVAETRATLRASTRALSADNIVEPEEELAVSEEGSQTQGSSRPGSKHARSTKSRSQLGSIAEDRGGTSRAPRRQTGKKNDFDWKRLHPFVVTCSETKTATKMAFPDGVVMNVKDLLTKLLLAVLFAEYKKPTQTYAKALIQAKMYLEASVRFLASLGVTKQAVFALATDGVEGALLMAWCSSDLETVYIVERNVRTFDISSPIEVYHFVTVLLRLREYGDTTLKKAIVAALNAEDFTQTSWNKTAQFNMMESGKP